MKYIRSLLLSCLLVFSFSGVEAKKRKNRNKKDKAVVKYGAIKFKSVQGKNGSSIAAADQGDVKNITLGGLKRKGRKISSGTLTILIKQSVIDSLEKGDKFDVVGLGNDTTSSPVVVTFQGQKTKLKGFSPKTTAFTATGDTTLQGKLKVKKYNAETGDIRFMLKAKARGYTKTKNSVNSEPSKPIKVKANVRMNLNN